MMRRELDWIVVWVGILALSAQAVSDPPGFAISRSTISGGGILRSTGGDYEMSATIGQPAAGTATGGPMAITAGIWLALSFGDCEEDGDVDLLDYKKFAACLTGPAPVGLVDGCLCFDANTSGTIDLADYHIVQASLTGP